MKASTEIGMNKTGMGTSPVHAKELIEDSAKTVPSTAGDGIGIVNERVAYAQKADPIGTVPPPPTLKGVMKTAAKALKGEHASVLIDKIGERLAFERMGTRLYEALLSKFEAFGTWDGGPTRDQLITIHNEEKLHFEMLRDVLEDLGADPTVQTPSADLTGVASMGIAQVLTDPRTTVLQCLDAILIAELADNDSWDVLVNMARAIGNEEMADKFEQALGEEVEHLRLVREWLKAGVGKELGSSLEAGTRH